MNEYTTAAEAVFRFGSEVIYDPFWLKDLQYAKIAASAIRSTGDWPAGLGSMDPEHLAMFILLVGEYENE